jgi:hypothetical protein
VRNPDFLAVRCLQEPAFRLHYRDVPGCLAAGLCRRVPRGAWQMEAAGRRYGFDLDLDFGFALLDCPDARALLLFLTSPPRVFMMGRSGTVWSSAFARPGRPAGHPRAARVHSVRTSGWHAVRALRGVARSRGQACSAERSAAARAVGWCPAGAGDFRWRDLGGGFGSSPAGRCWFGGRGYGGWCRAVGSPSCRRGWMD